MTKGGGGRGPYGLTIFVHCPIVQIESAALGGLMVYDTLQLLTAAISDLLIMRSLYVTRLHCFRVNRCDVGCLLLRPGHSKAEVHFSRRSHRYGDLTIPASTNDVIRI